MKAGANSLQYVIIGFVVTAVFVTGLFGGHHDRSSAAQRIPLPP